MRIFKNLSDKLKLFNKNHLVNQTKTITSLEAIEDAVNTKNISAIETAAEQKQAIVDAMAEVNSTLEANQGVLNQFLEANVDLLKRVGSLVDLEIEERTKEIAEEKEDENPNDRIF